MSFRPLPRRRRARAAAVAAVVLLPLAAAWMPSTASAAAPPAAQAGAVAEPSSTATVGSLQIENAFVSSTGWVKPGDSYPSQLVLRNTGTAAVADVAVTIPSPRGAIFTSARSAAGSATVTAGTVRWNVGSVAPGVTRLVLESTAATLEQEPTLVWRNLSSIASVTVGGSPVEVASRGPKVIPPFGGYETARYGDRPFPVVPVDYADSKHDPANPASKIDSVINDPANPGSTFNLFQENSYGQLYPKGTLGSLGAEGAAYSADDNLRFTRPDPAQTNTCQGTTAVNPSTGAPLPTYTQRVSQDGWYQLPGQRGYYGADANGSALVGAVAGVGALQAIDSGCGPTAKMAYDAAVAADPDIDYNDFDTNKDGVVDFFEVIFEGCGGNGSSQLGPAGGCPVQDTSDNVWPHSSSLEFSYTDPVTGQTGYVTKDRRRDAEGNLLFYTDNTYTTTTTDQTEFPAFVRVGPYNVNPETSLQFASVIGHEYGHSLGLPDFYSTGSRETYGDFNLLATDKSQNMDVIGKKEMGWIVPNVLQPGQNPVKGWQDSKIDTGTINWVTPDGTPYTLSSAGGDYGIHNGQAYEAALPGRQLIDPAKVSQGASGKQVWYSGQGNDFGCPPSGGRNLDIAIPGLGDLPQGTTIEAAFKSYFQIEWDYDYGFVLTGTPDDKGKVTYTSQASKNGYTTPATSNPNGNACQAKYGNGLTGTPQSYDAGTATTDRVLGNYPDGPFVQDAYDVSNLAGVDGGVLRFTYATDPGLAKLGWLMDDLVVTATLPDGTTKELFASDFENGDAGPSDPRVYNGGCKEDLSVSGGLCTEGWNYVAAGTPSELEHAYLMEMRDRSGFDYDGFGESDRAAIAFEPGLLLTYTDEAHGYGNVGTDNPPAQSPLDSTPEPSNDTPDLTNATFTAAADRSSFQDRAGKPHQDNYTEPSRGDNKAAGGDQPWTFDYNCLSFSVQKMSGNEVPDLATATPEQVAAGRKAFDLKGDVNLFLDTGCAPFNYGTQVGGPTPVTQARSLAAACPAGRVPTPRKDYEGNTHEQSIDCMLWWGVANGRTDGSYGPTGEVSRAQMASFVARLIEKGGGTLTAPAQDPFPKDDGGVHEQNINKLAAAGIISGRADGSYGPNDSVSRAQMAKFLVNAYEYVSAGTLRPVGDYFPDDNGATLEQFIDKAASGAFVQGRTDGRYFPADPVTRDAMASFLARTLDLWVGEQTTKAKA